jgi:hypothetical protein
LNAYYVSGNKLNLFDLRDLLRAINTSKSYTPKSISFNYFITSSTSSGRFSTYPSLNLPSGSASFFLSGAPLRTSFCFSIF